MNTFTRTAFFLILLCFQWANACYSQALSAKVKRIVFLGNSITYAGNYINDIEAYFISHFPEKHLEFINVGLPSETVSGLSEVGHAGGKFPRPDLHERLERVLAQTKPDLVFTCYGMNDGIYMPFDNSRFTKFKEGINWMHTMIVKSGARCIHLTPPVYDEFKGKSIGYAEVLDQYSNWLLSLRSEKKWEVIDIHYPMKKYLEAHRKVDSIFNLKGFALADDGVHPGETGHWIMARKILAYLGCKGAVASPGISESLAADANGIQILKLVEQRQLMMKHAWLTATKYIRPDIPEGLPLKEALEKYVEIEHEILALQ
ncbi:SGNH/GDSL hydrolase family protein [Segetibacter koreensis]|uniref:SGNH/GDSL hydrolase family protein n=1 Tax=Segetibacter koreensis TaxID=398037 RepID=UPI000368721B|nr:SGNH/GDSL hydrolase family protein [Segetibacter koreensis]